MRFLLMPLFGGLSACALAASSLEDVGRSFEALLDTPISSPSKRPQRPAEAPSMVSVIGADEIRRFGWRTLADALNSLRGIHVTYDRNTTYIGLRGFGRPGDYNSRVLMLIDGVSINDGIYDQAPVGADFPLDLALVERIEYVPGAGSVMYGGNAFFGVINVITAAGARRGSEIEVAAGAGREFGLRVTQGTRDETGNDWVLSASRTRSRGADLYFESYEQPGANAWSRGLDYQHVDHFFGRYARGGFGASLIASSRTKGVPGGPWNIDLDDARNRERELRVLGSLHYEMRASTDSMVYLQGHAAQYRYTGYWTTAGAAEPLDVAENTHFGGEARLVTTAFPAQALVFGVSWREDAKRRQYNGTLDADARRRSLGLFVQDDWSIAEWLMLSAGLRQDSIRDHSRATHFSPRLALIVQPLPATTVKLIAGNAFRSPNAFETDYSYLGTNDPNPALRPESIHSLELGIEQIFNGKTRISASLYRNHIHDLVALETDPLTGMQQHHNVGGATARGLELELRTPFATRWGEAAMRGSVAWQQARHESGAAIANTPARLVKLLLSAPLPGSLQLGWETHYLGPRTSDSGVVGVAGERVGGHALSHATLTGTLARGLSWQARVSNLFDRRYGLVAGTEFSAAFPAVQATPMPLMLQDGRSFHGSVRWSF